MIKNKMSRFLWFTVYLAVVASRGGSLCGSWHRGSTQICELWSVHNTCEM